MPPCHPITLIVAPLRPGPRAREHWTADRCLNRWRSWVVPPPPNKLESTDLHVYCHLCQSTDILMLAWRLCMYVEKPPGLDDHSRYQIGGVDLYCECSTARNPHQSRTRRLSCVDSLIEHRYRLQHELRQCTLHDQAAVCEAHPETKVMQEVKGMP